jgi:lysophospholipase L1-like esterase
MRILLVTDSHGRDMGTTIREVHSGWKIFTVRVGGVNTAVRASYLRRHRELRRFNPDRIILHVGHNDLQYHPYHNQSPEHGKYFFPSVLSFLALLMGNHPRATVFFSCPFPRTIGPGFTNDQRMVYNRTATRLGAMARSAANRSDFQCLLNGGLWKSVRKCQERPGILLPDGLHLSEAGRKVVVDGWIPRLVKP